MSSFLASQKTIVSSAKRRWEILTTCPLPLRILHPEMKPPSTTLQIRTLRTSIPMTNRYGDIGSPCRSPFELEKNPTGSPLTNTENVAVEMQLHIQSLHLAPNPIFCRTLIKNCQLRLSYAFQYLIYRLGLSLIFFAMSRSPHLRLEMHPKSAYPWRMHSNLGKPLYQSLF